MAKDESRRDRWVKASQRLRNAFQMAAVCQRVRAHQYPALPNRPGAGSAAGATGSVHAC